MSVAESVGAVADAEAPGPGLTPAGPTPPAEDDHHAKAQQKMVNFAKSATEKERNMTLIQGIRLYPKAIAWSMLISTCIVMEG